MSFLSGLVSGPGLTAATNVMGAFQGAQAEGAKEKVQMALQQAVLQRTIANQNIENQLKIKQGNEADATAAMRNRLAGKPNETYDANRGGIVNLDTNTFTATPGLPDKPTPPKITQVAEYTDLNGGPVMRDESGQYLDAAGKPLGPGSIKHYVAPVVPTNVYVTGTDPETGKPTIYAGKNKGSPELTDTGVGKPVAGAAGQTSAQAATAMQRLGMSLADVEAANKRMTTMENDPAFQQKLTVANQATMNAADVKPDIHASGLLGALNNAGGSLVSGVAQRHLNTTDPDLNTYRRDKELVGTALTEVLPRPNQQLLQIEKGLSGLDVGWNPAIMGAVQNRRAQGVMQLRNALSALQQGRGGAPVVNTPPSNVAPHPVVSKYGITPSQE